MRVPNPRCVGGVAMATRLDPAQAEPSVWKGPCYPGSREVDTPDNALELIHHHVDQRDVLSGMHFPENPRMVSVARLTSTCHGQHGVDEYSPSN